MKKNVMRNILMGSIAFVVLLAILALLLSFKGNNSNINAEELAKCLTEKGVNMYGAYWCPHCQEQKALFGESFKFVNYTECTENKAICDSEKIEYYPAWKIDGQISYGKLDLQELKRQSGC